ncbi:hypothetical protein RchiOBHm_Chr1g0331591 [Rosa chinensis]|uniref:Uncharacterized protein n=1 Tax=Rosa chinensis TaxID=74649 RepID=A0A2P6SBK1_ROSCH|nr:hypothetical protein RchiOBHm_Chr1g0331591 [Rosa chinensis]
MGLSLLSNLTCSNLDSYFTSLQTPSPKTRNPRVPIPKPFFLDLKWPFQEEKKIHDKKPPISQSLILDFNQSLHFISQPLHLRFKLQTLCISSSLIRQGFIWSSLRISSTRAPPSTNSFSTASRPKRHCRHANFVPLFISRLTLPELKSGQGFVDLGLELRLLISSKSAFSLWYLGLWVACFCGGDEPLSHGFKISQRNSVSECC